MMGATTCAEVDLNKLLAFRLDIVSMMENE